MDNETNKNKNSQSKRSYTTFREVILHPSSVDMDSRIIFYLFSGETLQWNVDYAPFILTEDILVLLTSFLLSLFYDTFST
jgi:hypothetical protein